MEFHNWWWRFDNCAGRLSTRQTRKKSTRKEIQKHINQIINDRKGLVKEFSRDEQMTADWKSKSNFWSTERPFAESDQKEKV